MYAIVDIAGQQFKVEKDQKIFVHRLEGEEGSQIDFDKVLLIDNDQNVTVGAPVIEGAMVSAKILGHLKADKVIVFKKKRRKGYQKRNGHRQYLTQIVVEDIIEKGAKPKAEVKKQEKPKAETKPEVKKEVKAETKAKPEAKKEVKTETKAETSGKKPAAETKAKTETKKAPVKKEAKAKSGTAKKTTAKAAPKKTKNTPDSGEKESKNKE